MKLLNRGTYKRSDTPTILLKWIILKNCVNVTVLWVYFFNQRQYRDFFFFFTCVFKLENQICVRSLRKVTPSHISTLTAYMCQTELLTAN